ncbi:hypothetical protein [Fusibacter sp. JL216-2]|uniref:hypothetical protein n=1 Tax=Fusibacter sp. JL216-2 TaxID=3071453 RepID=UPI003D330EC0
MNKNKALTYILTSLLIICGWFSMVYIGYQHAKDTLDASVQDIKLEHALQIQELNTKIQEVNRENAVLRNDVIALNNEIKRFNDGLQGMLVRLEIIDTNIVDSEEVQLEISAYLDALDKRLSALQKSLETLEVAPNESN